VCVHSVSARLVGSLVHRGSEPERCADLCLPGILAYWTCPRHVCTLCEAVGCVVVVWTPGFGSSMPRAAAAAAAAAAKTYMRLQCCLLTLPAARVVAVCQAPDSCKSSSSSAYSSSGLIGSWWCCCCAFGMGLHVAVNSPNFGSLGQPNTPPRVSGRRLMPYSCRCPMPAQAQHSCRHNCVTLV